MYSAQTENPSLCYTNCLHRNANPWSRCPSSFLLFISEENVYLLSGFVSIEQSKDISERNVLKSNHLYIKENCEQSYNPTICAILNRIAAVGGVSRRGRYPPPITHAICELQETAFYFWQKWNVYFTYFITQNEIIITVRKILWLGWFSQNKCAILIKKKGKFRVFKTKYNQLKLNFVINYWKWLIITNTFYLIWKWASKDVLIAVVASRKR